MTRNLSYLILSLFCLVALSVISCDGPLQTDNGVFSVSVKKSGDLFPADDGGAFVSVVASGDWTLALSTADSSEPWGTLSHSSGNGSKANVILSYEANVSDDKRSMDIVLRSADGRREARATVVQAAKQSGGDTPDPPVKPDPVSAWLELPAVAEGAAFYTHDQTLGSRKVRSWSFLWDDDALVAHWVAYPLNAWTIGSGSRTDEWGLDPKIPRSRQPVLYSGYKGGYDRGHQLPSADRLNYAANVTTFYGTNMTPQLGSLNQRTWANLEGRVRDWARAFDTLYVVTGCVVEGSTKVAYDNDGKAVKVPSGYYKALLGYKKGGTLGITARTGGYTSIAFYFNHQGYSGDYMNMAMTVDALEQKVGEDFFVNLPSIIGTGFADIVESSEDSWWYN